MGALRSGVTHFELIGTDMSPRLGSAKSLGNGGDGGIRTRDTFLGYAHLANECLQPLGHVSVTRSIDGTGGKFKDNRAMCAESERG